MTIATEVKADHQDLTEMMIEAEEKAIEVTQCWGEEATEYDFEDGSLLIVRNSEANCYASR